MATKRFPARLHVLFARGSSLALVIRRGPSKTVCTCSWDRDDDTFKVGQWMRGRIYERRCDLSPDGKHFIYFAMNGRWNSKMLGSWTAISRAPYLKALALFSKGDCWHGGGLFLSADKYWLNGCGYTEIQASSAFRRDLEISRRGITEASARASITTACSATDGCSSHRTITERWYLKSRCRVRGRCANLPF
jgi:hypothetical protein